MPKQPLVRAFSFKPAEITCSSSVETLVSTTETLPYVDDAPIDIELCSNPSTICLESDSEEEIELQTHHVNDNRPLAPYTVISETSLNNTGETHTNEIETPSQARNDLVILSLRVA